MKLHILFWIKIVIPALFFYSGCAGNISYTKPAPKPVTYHNPPIEPLISPNISTLDKSSEKNPGKTEKKPLHNPVASPELPQITDQERLDSALEFCQASNDFFEHGDLDNALDALDQSYSLILKIKPDQAHSILQQRDDLRVTISKRIIQVYASRFTVANGEHDAIPLIINKHIERAIKLFKGPEKKFFIDSYRRSGRYRPYIIKALKEAGMPEELSWLPLIESGFKLRALSRARALGLWQFIASTGYKFGLKRDTWIDERMDPEKSTLAAVAYLKELHQIFGDWTTSLASYNCGEGLVLRRIKSQHINYLDDFWDLYKTLPRETAFYVPKFIAVLHILKDPKAYGFDLPEVDKVPETEIISINKQVDIKAIAKAIDIPYKVLDELNSSLRLHATPNRPYDIKVPNGKGQILIAKIDTVPAWKPPSSTYVIHRVKIGESLSVIAERYRTSVKSIMLMNKIRKPSFIKAGRKIKIPTRKSYPRKNRKRSLASVKINGNNIEYTVRKGDSLWMLANRFHTTTRRIRTQNKLKTSNLRIGQTLIIPGNLTGLKGIKTKSYRVLEGESPYVIAQKYQMSLAKFLTLNNLTPRSKIYPGQKLLVKAD